MLNVEYFKRGDIDEIELNYAMTQAERTSFENYNNIVGFTARKDGKIVVMGGAHVMWRGVGEGWLIMSKYGYDMPKTVARYADEFFDVIMTEANLQRVQASVNALDPRSVRFARWLGFENEGLMRKYGPDGTDYYRMARVS